MYENQKERKPVASRSMPPSSTVKAINLPLTVSPDILTKKKDATGNDDALSVSNVNTLELTSIVDLLLQESVKDLESKCYASM